MSQEWTDLQNLPFVVPVHARNIRGKCGNGFMFWLGCATIGRMRVDNFGAGPCTLPLGILEEAREEFLDFSGSGMSVLEMSHRSEVYSAVHAQALSLAREVSGAPAHFEVMVIPGGATMQFAMVPVNLLGNRNKGAYVTAGSWGVLALGDAQRWGDAYCAWDGKPHRYARMPLADEVAIRPDTAFLHLTSNETIGGIRMVESLEVDLPQVCDMSSDFLSRPIDWDRYHLVYGGVQKNLAPAGMALVFIRRSMLEGISPVLPRMLDYRWYAAKDSLGNTPPVFPIYLMGKMLKRIRDLGGIPGLEERTARKAGLVYEVIDQSDGYYHSPVVRRYRSHTNVVFRLPTAEAEARFLRESHAAGLVGLRGHKSVGGCRASLYAGLEVDSAQRLASFMDDFRLNRA
ncbi:MAG: 3-phosphoserine/phosphohydroxythreonine transaminase [Acidimicrobiia bacterium]|nr:3-phosphoserine/phosphohydroxythreonine transaminase [Acidimicrobiia bacterium]MXY73391.1 3-phosphoserine/phosphohydroxythreonine transaminase [Acidimicrobiia bacterium]MYB78782.1 3-phosphoserine/phosphohydroxythreonine transaminase [Acidimicrobiia bacterium]